MIIIFCTAALDAPKDLQAISQTDSSITLEWRNSEADVGSYRVKYSPISGAAHGEEVFPRGPGDTTQATITGKGQRHLFIKYDSTQLPDFLCISQGQVVNVPSSSSISLNYGRAKTRDGVRDRSDRREERERESPRHDQRGNW